MVKAQFDENNDRVHLTVPKSTAKIVGWYEKLKSGEVVEVDGSPLPDKNGVAFREVR